MTSSVPCLSREGRNSINLKVFTAYQILLLDAGPVNQGMQDESGAKSGNWLAEFVYVVSASFSILFS